MNKEETIKDIQNIINANCWTISEHFAKNVATALYNAGYGKVEEKDETAIRAMTNFVELLEEFDEMGYAPTTLCENPEEEANKWKSKALFNFDIVLRRIENLTIPQKRRLEEYKQYRKDIEEKEKLIEEYSHKNTVLAAENAKLSLKLRQVLLSIDTVKEMNDMCNIDEQRKQAVHDFMYPILLSLQCRIDDNFDSPEYEEVYRLVKEYLEDELKEFDNE